MRSLETRDIASIASVVAADGPVRLRQRHPRRTPCNSTVVVARIVGSAEKNCLSRRARYGRLRHRLTGRQPLPRSDSGASWFCVNGDAVVRADARSGSQPRFFLRFRILPRSMITSCS